MCSIESLCLGHPERPPLDPSISGRGRVKEYLKVPETRRKTYRGGKTERDKVIVDRVPTFVGNGTLVLNFVGWDRSSPRVKSPDSPRDTQSTDRIRVTDSDLLPHTGTKVGEPSPSHTNVLNRRRLSDPNRLWRFIQTPSSTFVDGCLYKRISYITESDSSIHTLIPVPYTVKYRIKVQQVMTETEPCGAGPLP